MWSGGDYEYPDMQRLLKKLERPISGSGGQRITGIFGFEAETPQPETHHYPVIDEDAPLLTYMPESLFILPDSFHDDQIAQVWRHWDNPEVLFAAGDVDKVDQFTEEEAVAIFANYGQVREYLHKKPLNRGFFSAAAPGAKGKGKGKGKGEGYFAIKDRPSPFAGGEILNTARPKMWSKDSLIARTKCARCGKVGHWGRTCTNPLDERGGRRGVGTHFCITDADAATAS